MPQTSPHAVTLRLARGTVRWDFSGLAADRALKAGVDPLEVLGRFAEVDPDTVTNAQMCQYWADVLYIGALGTDEKAERGPDLGYLEMLRVQGALAPVLRGVPSGEEEGDEGKG